MPAGSESYDGRNMPGGCDRENVLSERAAAARCELLASSAGRPESVDDSRRTDPDHLNAMILKVKVIPKSAKTEIVGTMADGTVKVRVAAVAEKGKANAELVAFLAKYYGVGRERVSIVTGETSPVKQIRIDN
jgi:uncharacterized protein (TIGR00251 family)